MIDTKSETWESVETFLAKELPAISRKLSNKNSDFADTQFNRGYKAALEVIQELPTKEPVKQVDSDDYFA